MNNGYSVRNQIVLQKYLEPVNNLYAEPKNEEILDSFIAPEPKRTAPVSRKNERIAKQNTTTQGVDIRSLFKRLENQNRKQNNELQGEIEADENSIIVID